MYKLAIFDLDGTLVNSVEDLANAVNITLTAMGYPTHPLEAFYHFVGNGVKVLCQRALPETATEEEADRLLTDFNAYYAAHCLDCTKPYEGMIPLLKKLKEANITLAVASNKPQPFVEQIVTTLFGDNVFDLILGSSDSRPKKPAPDILLELLRLSATDKADAVLIGDSDVDILTAQNAEMDAIGCTWGFRGREELLRAGAKFLADLPSELENLILGA